MYLQLQTATPSGEHQTARSLTWAVAAAPSDTLVDKSTGAEVFYPYWEATYVCFEIPFSCFDAEWIDSPSFPPTWFSSANIHLATPNVSRATTPTGDIETFDPSRPSVSSGDSILLPVGKVPGYLDAAFKALVLHTEARTPFITYAHPLLPIFPPQVTSGEFP